MAAPLPIVHGALILVSVLFGVNYVLYADVLQAVDPRAWVHIRVLSATIFLTPLLLAQRQPLPHPKRQPRIYLWLVLATVLGVLVNQILFTEGLRRTTPEHAAVITTAIPVMTLLIAWLARQEGLTWLKVSAVAVAMLGVGTLLEVDRMLQDSSQLGDYWVGDLLVLANVTSFSGFVVVMRHVGPKVPATAATWITFSFAAICMLPWSFGHWDGAVDATLGAGIWPKALFCVLGATVMTYLLNNWALRRVNSSLVVLYIYVQPVVATALQAARGKANTGPRFWIAGALVFVGILLAATDSWKSQKTQKTVESPQTGSPNPRQSPSS